MENVHLFCRLLSCRLNCRFLVNTEAVKNPAIEAKLQTVWEGPLADHLQIDRLILYCLSWLIVSPYLLLWPITCSPFIASLICRTQLCRVYWVHVNGYSDINVYPDVNVYSDASMLECPALHINSLLSTAMQFELSNSSSSHNVLIVWAGTTQLINRSIYFTACTYDARIIFSIFCLIIYELYS